ncbi:MAG: energy transducer TonB [Planctomycetota bacterium]|nr:energy transducer TonB [Planctomycetota bacterium]
MKAWGFIGIVFAVVLHAGFILFGGLLLPEEKTNHGTTHTVDLVGDAAAPEKQKKKEEPKETKTTTEKVENSDEPPPDADSLKASLDATDVARGPALDLVDLAAIGSALSGAGAEGFGGESVGFGMGGQVGGKGKGVLGETKEAAFDMSDIDQKPRAVFQASPTYPAEMRGRKIEGVVSVLFVVDETGKVARQRVDKSNNEAFEKPALDAVKQWKFEPAVKGGKRVACKMRVSLRFQAN